MPITPKRGSFLHADSHRGMPVSGLIDQRKPPSWPMDLRFYLESYHDLFLGSEQGDVAAHLYEQAIHGLIDVLQPYAITGLALHPPH